MVTRPSGTLTSSSLVQNRLRATVVLRRRHLAPGPPPPSREYGRTAAGQRKIACTIAPDVDFSPPPTPSIEGGMITKKIRAISKLVEPFWLLYHFYIAISSIIIGADHRATQLIIFATIFAWLPSGSVSLTLVGTGLERTGES